MTQKYGYLANGVAVESKPCLVCDIESPRYSWTDLNGEGYCLQCGSPYQLANGTLREGETYPRFNIDPNFIPVMKEFYADTGQPNGLGTFLSWSDYPDQLAGRVAFNKWLEEKHPELCSGKEGS